MNNREYFHESVVKDIVDILTSVKDFDEVQFLSNLNNNRSFKSITSATKDLILTFPVMVSSDIDPSNAVMIAKAQEKKCASLLHILFTSISVGNNEDIYDYVKKFHSNLGSMNNTFEDYLDAIDNIASTFDENAEMRNTISKDTLDIVLRELKESNYILPDDINENNISDMRILPKGKYGDSIVIGEAGNKPSVPPRSVVNNIQRQHYKQIYDTFSKGVNQITKNATDTIKNALGNNRRDSILPNNIKDAESVAKTISSRTDAINKSILNTEYKKANELAPTMMVVNFLKKDADNNKVGVSTAIIGIKAKLYTVDSIDICDRISSKIADKNILNSFIRATTNEISFFKDFLFAIDKAKLDALSYKEGNSNKLWKVLERRSLKSKFRRSLKMYNDATAITTLVLSNNDADRIRQNGSVDIRNVSFARKLLDSYNLMCLCIVNESVETVDFLYDTGEDNYEKLTFSNLEREASDNSYKKIVNLLTKMNR